MSDLKTLRPKGNATVPDDAPFATPQAFVDAFYSLFHDGLKNIQKLGLPVTLPVGTQVEISDWIIASGGTQDGVYYKNADPDIAGNSSKPIFILIGTGSYSSNSVYWDNPSQEWYFYDSEASPIYYSDEDVETPDLVLQWFNESDDSPASITVTSPAIQQLVTPDPSNESHWEFP